MSRRTLLIALLLALSVPLPTGSAAPALVEAKTVDRDADGRLDAIDLFFDSAIDERLLDLADFTVAEYTILSYEMASTSILRLLLQERPGFDSGATPRVSFEVVGNDGAVTRDSVLPADNVAPVLVTVLAEVGGFDVRMRWSEAVVGEGGEVLHSDLDYGERSGGGANSVANVVTDGSDLVVTLNAELTEDDVAQDTLAAGSKVKDAAGNSADSRSRPLEGPRVVEAVTDIGSDQVRVRFNVPLASVPSAGSFDVVYDQPPDDPIAGVLSVSSGGSGDEVLVALAFSEEDSTPWVSSRDVRSLEPAFLAASPDDFSARGIHGGETLAFRPDRVPLKDRTQPTVAADADGPAVLTQDRNRNGLLDALLVRFSEPIVATCSDGITVELHRNGGVVPYELALAGNVPRTEGADNVLLVPLQERTTHEPDTGLVPDLIVRTCTDSGRMPFEDRAEVTGGSTVRGNPVLPVGLASVQESDGAPPVVLRAVSQDRDQDGLLDAYVLSFSESLVQGAFKASLWNVEGLTVSGGLWDGSNTLILELDENPEVSSGDLPRIGYAGGGAEDLRDPSGNPLEPFTRGNFPLVDGAGPRIVRVYGDVGQRHLRIEFSEAVEGVTGAESGSSGPGRKLVESDFFYDNVDGAGVTGITEVLHTPGDKQALLRLTGPLRPGDLSPDGTAGDAVRALQGHIREANGDASQDRDLVSGEPVHLLRLDTDAPGSPGGTEGADGVTVEAGVSDATLTFPATADDAEYPENGAVDSYRVYVSDEPLPVDGSAAAIDAIRALPAWDTVTVGTAPEVGGEQTLTVHKLCPSSTVHLAIESLDDFLNPSAPVVLGAVTLQDDSTPALGEQGTVVLRSATHPLRDGVAVQSTRTEGSVTWTGFTDPEACQLQYFWVVDDNDSLVLDDESVAAAQAVPDEGGSLDTVYVTPDAGARFDLSGVERPSTKTLHVAARSGGGFSLTYHYPLDLVLPVPCLAEKLLLPDVEAIRKDGVTTVTWGAYPNGLPPDVELEGYQVWLRPARGSQLLREELENPTDGFEQRRFLDDMRLREGDSYYVTAYFTDGMCRFAWDETALLSGLDPGGPNATFGAVQASIIPDPPSVPAWAWVTLAVVAMLVVGGLVLFFAMRHQRLDESWLHEDEDLHDPDNPFGPDPSEAVEEGGSAQADPFGGRATNPLAKLGAAAAASLEVTCPACTHRFHAQGARPLALVCPNCSASGTLE